MLSTKEAIQYLKDNGIEITREGLRYLRIHSNIRFSCDGFYYRYSSNSLCEFIIQRKNIPNSKIWIKINDLAVELHVHVSRIYRKVKEYNTDIKNHRGINYVHKQQFIKKYKEEYNGSTDRRKEARN